MATDILTSYTTALDTTDSSSPLAAVSALTTALRARDTTTAAETLSTLDALAQELYASLRHAYASSHPSSTGSPKDAAEHALLSAYPARAGTELFQRLLVTTLQRPQTAGSGNDSAVLTSLIETFLARGLAARKAIKALGKRVVGEGQSVLVPALDGRVPALAAGMLADAEAQGVLFDAVYIVADESVTCERGGGVVVTATELPAFLKRLVATQGSAEILVLADVHALLADGGCLATQGHHSIFSAAREMSCKIWCAAEGRACLRWFPLGGGAQQRIDDKGYSDTKVATSTLGLTTLEVVPAGMVTGGYVTESGVLSPQAVAEEVVGLFC